MLTNHPLPPSNPLRDSITNAYRMDESQCIKHLLSEAVLPEVARERIIKQAALFAQRSRAYKKEQGKIDKLLHQYDLSTEEGVALMCLAEALLRIPDKATMDKLISDKLSPMNWKKHLDKDQPLFINAATWSLLLTGKIYASTIENEATLSSSLQRVGSRIGIAVIRPLVLQMMKSIGKQFVIGETIESALKNSRALASKGYLFSYDMLGEAARTAEDAELYYHTYAHAIEAIGKEANPSKPHENPGISVKLSALHPRYEFTQRERVLTELPPRLLALAELAKRNNIFLVVDAEEADRLDLSLDIFAIVFADPKLDNWEGFGLAVQAYQKRAFPLLDWLIALSKEKNKRIRVRLVKGAYWDAEIKLTQLQGLNNYPVFTRKDSTDLSYLACAKKMLTNQACFFSQFGTHNAYTVSAVMEMATLLQTTDYEFEGLFGMARPLYDQIVSDHAYHPPCRMYAPVGTHKDLLGYLVRRLLENGANNSFLKLLSDDKTPIEKIVTDPVSRMASLTIIPHPKIPLPKDIYGLWQNSQGIDLSNAHEFSKLKRQMDRIANSTWSASSLIAANTRSEGEEFVIFSPSDQSKIGVAKQADEQTLLAALSAATAATKTWGQTSVSARATILERAAERFQQEMPYLITLLSKEGGKCILDCLSEVREAIDYCRYYAYRAREDMKTQLLPGVTGEANQFSLHPRGVIACISPWNFPLAIFTGQIVAALATGNAVIAKPSEQTPLIAYKAVQILHESGVPRDALQLLIGPGSVIGASLVKDERVAGVIFTGSTATAKSIERALANRTGPIATFIAETGGQNAMIVDSSALPEQAAMDIIQSAFNSAGQRCSALRVLFVQEEIAPKLITILKGYLAELKIGDPSLLSTDIGPVIDKKALQMLQSHYASMIREANLIAQAPMKIEKMGSFFAPCIFELADLSPLKGEVFGPILHVIRYQSHSLTKVMDAIISTGYGLTLGIQSRIDATTQYLTSRMPVGNRYVNRNMIGAVVGVQPFGGERLSGTGPKAGGPHYLPRLCLERALSINTTAVGGNAHLVSLLEED